MAAAKTFIGKKAKIDVIIKDNFLSINSLRILKNKKIEIMLKNSWKIITKLLVVKKFNGKKVRE